MAGDIAYRLTADEAQALQAVARLSREFGLNESAIKKAADAAKELDRTQQQMGREAQRIFQETRTPLEEYQQQLEKIDKLYQQGAIDVETHGRATTQAADRYNTALKQVHSQQEATFGSKAISQMQSFASSITGVTSATQLLIDAMDKLNAAKERGAQSDRTAEMAEGSLAEVAGGDPEQYKKLLDKSRGLAAKSGMSRQQAAALTFAAASAGAVDQMDVFADLYGQGVVQDPEALMRATQTLQTSMGRKQTGSLRDITSKLLAAGEHSPQKIAQLGPAAALAGVNAQDAGVSADELLAAVAVQSKATGEASIAGTMQKSLQKALARLRSGKDEAGNELATDEEGHLLDQSAKAVRAAVRHKLSGAQGLMGELHAVQSLGLDDAALQKLFGRQEGLMGYKLLLRNEGEFNEAKAGIGSAAGKDLAGRVLALPDADARAIGAKLARTGAAQQEEAEAAAYGSETNAVKGVLASAHAHMISHGEGATSVMQDVVEGTFGRIPGINRAQARYFLREDKTDLDSAHLVAAVKQLGGREQVFGANAKGAGVDKFDRAVSELANAAQNLNTAQQRPRPTLAPPNAEN